MAKGSLSTQQHLNLCIRNGLTFVLLHCQTLNCLAVLSVLLLFDLVHSWKLLPRSLTHSCVFEAGEHPHTHTSTDPGSWLVLNPWQGALSLNIKDLHLRACRHDSHPGLSSSQQVTERPTRWIWRAATAGRWSDAATSPRRRPYSAVFVAQLCEHVKIPAV